MNANCGGKVNSDSTLSNLSERRLLGWPEEWLKLILASLKCMKIVKSKGKCPWTNKNPAEKSIRFDFRVFVQSVGVSDNRITYIQKKISSHFKWSIE